VRRYHAILLCNSSLTLQGRETARTRVCAGCIRRCSRLILRLLDDRAHTGRSADVHRLRCARHIPTSEDAGPTRGLIRNPAVGCLIARLGLVEIHLWRYKDAYADG
jgi:hypothetical protein